MHFARRLLAGQPQVLNPLDTRWRIMTEVWLRPNRRVLCLGMILPGIFLVIGLVHLWGVWSGARWGSPLVGWVLSIAGGVLFAMLVSHALRPRLAYQDGRLL